MALVVIVILHFLVVGIKVFYMGLFSGLTDLAAAIILIVGIVRFDYCLLISYIVLNLFEVFALIVVLGYYLQTDMGKNAPDNQEKNEDKGEDSQENKSKSHSIRTKGKASVIIMFRTIFDKFLKLKYTFY